MCYAFDDSDSEAISNGIEGTEAESDRRFDYEFAGVESLSISIANDNGTFMTHVYISSPLHLVERVETALNIAANYGLSNNRWGNDKGS
ncbi:hypothetical protein N8590_02530 [bacterium]|nr:hypothetical protein [bacterium]MDA7527841.1 hypothetical protein [bacterium]MDB4731585.1 hypothetical protein [bacterium]